MAQYPIGIWLSVSLESTGFALEDYSALCLLRDLAAELSKGQKVSLVPNLPDPKDLFSLIRPQQAAGMRVGRVVTEYALAA